MSLTRWISTVASLALPIATALTASLVDGPRLSVSRAHADSVTYVPGLVLGLRHTGCKKVRVLHGCGPGSKDCPRGNTDGQVADPFIRRNGWLEYRCTPDYGAPKGINFTFTMMKILDGVKPNYIKQLPPGLVVAFHHYLSNEPLPRVMGVHGFMNLNQLIARAKEVGLRYEYAVDAAPSKFPLYFWFETTGEHFVDWSIIDRLPKYTTLALRHSTNHAKGGDLGQPIRWGNVSYDPRCTTCAVPPGFIRVFGGDYGAPKYTGFHWFEKAVGPNPDQLSQPLVSSGVQRPASPTYRPPPAPHTR